MLIDTRSTVIATCSQLSQGLTPPHSTQNGSNKRSIGINHEPMQQLASNRREQSIGKPMGCIAWVLDPTNPSRMVGVGAPGELYLEGALLSPGYLGDTEKSSHAFIESPTWLKRGRLYKTGDLVRQDPETLALFYIGRADSQLKLHGQRVEALEIEEHIKNALPNDLKSKVQVVVVLALLVGIKRPVLVCALSDHRPGLINQIDAALSSKIPLWMTPSAYVSIPAIPTTSTGKLDRRKLRQIVEDLPSDQMQRPDQAVLRRSPSTVQEGQLHNVVADVLGIDQAQIGVDDNLIKLGMDSIAVMRFVAAARRAGLSFTASAVFRHPQISHIAKEATITADKEMEEVLPYSILPTTTNIIEIQSVVARLCGVGASQVLDVMPVLPLQEGLIALSARIAGAYTADFQESFAADALVVRTALGHLSERWPILRTRIVQLAGHDMVQAVLNYPMPCQEKDIEPAKDSTKHDQHMGLGTSLARTKLSHDSQSGTTLLQMKLHHAIYDAWSLSMMFADLRAIVEALHNGSNTVVATPRSPGFQYFVKHVVGVEKKKAEHYWVSQCTGLQSPSFPTLPSPSYQPQADEFVECTLTDIAWPANRSVTPSTMIRAALAILIANRTASEDALLGKQMHGRNSIVDYISAACSLQ